MPPKPKAKAKAPKSTAKSMRPRGRPKVLLTLREAREKRALSLSDLGALAGVSRMTIWKAEQALVVPALRTRRRLADALKMEVDALDWPI